MCVLLSSSLVAVLCLLSAPLGWTVENVRFAFDMNDANEIGPDGVESLAPLRDTLEEGRDFS